MNKLFVVAFIIAIAAGCGWENEETLYPGPEICDTLDVSFAEDIIPILTNNCFTCHSNANAPDFTFGFGLEDYQDVSAASILIVGAINHEEGSIAMPKNADKLDTCLINTIEAWVNQGSLNN